MNDSDNRNSYGLSPGACIPVGKKADSPNLMGKLDHINGLLHEAIMKADRIKETMYGSEPACEDSMCASTEDSYESIINSIGRRAEELDATLTSVLNRM